MPFISKLYQLLIRGLIFDTKVIASYLFSYLNGTKSLQLDIVRFDDLATQLQNGKSLIRIGDGEAMLMTGRDIHFQKTSLPLKKALRTILNDYNAHSQFLLCVPLDALLETDEALKQKQRYRIWRLFRCFCRIHLKISIPYADAHIFYNKQYLQNILPLVIRNKHIICITKKENIDEALKTYLNEYSQCTTYIETPSKNAYEKIESLEGKISTALLKHHDKMPILLLAAGPASKVIAYNFITKNKIQCLDIGHGIEIIGKDKDYKDLI